jgi:hypothetical protein
MEIGTRDLADTEENHEDPPDAAVQKWFCGVCIAAVPVLVYFKLLPEEAAPVIPSCSRHSTCKSRRSKLFCER